MLHVAGPWQLRPAVPAGEQLPLRQKLQARCVPPAPQLGPPCRPTGQALLLSMLRPAGQRRAQRLPVAQPLQPAARCRRPPAPRRCPSPREWRTAARQAPSCCCRAAGGAAAGAPHGACCRPHALAPPAARCHQRPHLQPAARLLPRPGPPPQHHRSRGACCCHRPHPPSCAAGWPPRTPCWPAWRRLWRRCWQRGCRASCLPGRQRRPGWARRQGRMPLESGARPPACTPAEASTGLQAGGTLEVRQCHGA